MDFNIQIDELNTKKNDLIALINDMKVRQATHKSDNGRLRRMINALKENDIIYNNDNGDPVSLANTLQTIIINKDVMIDDMQKYIDTFNTEIKKYNKAIDTLTALMDVKAA